MNIFNKVALQGLKKNRTRTLVTIIGVVLSAAMITAVATFGTSLLNYLVNGSIAKYGDWHVEFLNVDSSFLQERTNDKEVENTASFAEIGYAQLEGGKSPDKPYLFIAGFNEKTADTLPVSLISGRMPENSGEILVPAHVAAKSGVRYRVGDTISLAVGKRMDGDRILTQHDPYQSGENAGENKEVLVPEINRTYTVVGSYERPGFEEHSAPGYTMITKMDAENQAERFTQFVTLKNPRSVQNYAKTYAESIDEKNSKSTNGESADGKIRAAGSGEYVLNDDLLRFMGVSEDTLFNAILYSVGGILVAIIMVGSVFLIYNSFHISLNERTQQFGILSSVGATTKQLRNSVLFEGICIGILSIPIGILVGIGSIAIVIPIVAGNFGNILSSGVPLTLSVSAAAIVAAALVSLITILISAYIPARKAANTPVMECIRQTNEIKIEAKAVKTSKRSQRIYGLEGVLALENFKRNKKRYRSIILSLVLSVVLFVSGNAFGTTLKRLSEQYTMDFDYDILFTAENMSDSESVSLYDKLKNVDGVYESMSQSVYPYLCTVNANDLSDRYKQYAGYTEPDEMVQLPMELQFIEDSEYLRFAKEKGLDTDEYTGQDGKRLAIARQKIHNQGGSTIEVIDAFAKDSATYSASPETEDEIMKQWGINVDVTFVDTYSVDPPPSEGNSENPLVFMMIAPYSLKDNFETPDTNSRAGFGFRSKTPLQTVGDMETMLEEAGLSTPYTLYSVYAVVDQFRNVTFVVDIFTYIFVIMISLIAVANVFNTIATNIKLRRRELAMLRSVGMSDHDFNKMMNFECIFYGMRTLIFGLPIAGMISWLIYKGMMMAEGMDDFKFQLPWGSMAISVLGVFFIVFITMLYATSKIKKENIIDALRDDMT